MWLLEEVAQQGETQGERRTFTFCARSDGEPAEACVGRKQKDPAPSAAPPTGVTLKVAGLKSVSPLLLMRPTG